MKKIALLAATTLAIAPTVASAQSASIQVSRQYLVAAGLAGSSLLTTETASLTGTTTASATCSLTYDHPTIAPTGVAQSVPASGGTATVTQSNFTLYASRVNPQGQSIGQATYGALGGGAATWAPTLTQANTDLSCPSGGTYEVQTQAQSGGEQLTSGGTVEDTACRAARKTFVDHHNSTPHTDPNDPNHKDNHNLGYAYETHCPNIVTGPTFAPIIPAQFATHNYSYVLGTITFGSTLTGSGTVDGVTFTF